MIEFLSGIASSFNGLMDLWGNVVSPIANPDWIIGSLVVFFVIALFFVIRFEVKYCSKLWIGQGILEFMVAGVLSVAAVMLIYFLPLLLLAACFTYLTWAFIVVITWLAQFSVRGVK